MADWKCRVCAPNTTQPHSSLAQAASLGNREDFNPQYMPLVEWPKDANGEVFTLHPIFRLPHLIHTRSGIRNFSTRSRTKIRFG